MARDDPLKTPAKFIIASPPWRRAGYLISSRPLTTQMMDQRTLGRFMGGGPPKKTVVRRLSKSGGAVVAPPFPGVGLFLGLSAGERR